MAGQITISTLRNDTGVLATQNGMTGIAKAWVNWNGVGTVAILTSFNVSSVVRNAEGDFTINFTTAMPSANYVIHGTVSNTGDEWINEYAGSSRGVCGIHQRGVAGSQPTASAVRVNTLFGAQSGFNGGTANFSRNYVSIFSS